MYNVELFDLIVEESKKIYHDFINRLLLVEKTADSINPIIEESEAVNIVMVFYLENDLMEEKRNITTEDRDRIAAIIFNYLDANYTLLENCNCNKSCLNKFREAYIKVTGESLRLLSF